MLYIWPLIAFFSAPLLLGSAAQAVGFTSRILTPGEIPVAQSLSQQRGPGPDANAHPTKAGASSRRQQSPALVSAVRFFGTKQYVGPLIVGFHVIAFLVVRYNTIIHPFTLADNRHYMFYIFRYTILRPGWVRYFLVPVYVSCARLCWSTLAGSCDSFDVDAEAPDGQTRRLAIPRPGHINTPFGSTRMRSLGREHRPTTPVADAKDDAFEALRTHGSAPFSSAAGPPLSSTAVLWLLATTLSLITAPLVEPRYFILPWLFWRLLVPPWKAHDGRGGALQLGPWRWPDRLVRFGRAYDPRLFLETLWFFLINAATMYIFISRPYQWKAADGSVMDGGKWQRFLW